MTKKKKPKAKAETKPKAAAKAEPEATAEAKLGARAKTGKFSRRQRIARRRVAIGAAILTAIILATAFFLFIVWNNGPSKNAEVKFSQATGLYEQEIEVELSVDQPLWQPFTEIRYTLNGDNPAKSGEAYTEPIKLKTGEKLEVYPIKACYCYVGGKCGEVSERTFFLSRDPETDLSLEAISITSDHDNLYDYETGILVPGKWYDEYLDYVKAYGRYQEDTYIRGNYNNRADDWIRGAQVVRIDSDGQVEWDQDVGMQVSGNASAELPVKSLKLVAKDRYGYEKLAYSFDDFYEAGNITTGLEVPTKYNTLKLKSGLINETSTQIKTSLASRLMAESGFDGYAATGRAVVYLNGEYYGIFTVMQNYTESFLRKRFGLKEKDQIEKMKSAEENVFSRADIRKYFEEDLTLAENRQALEEVVDMDNYLMYYALAVLWGKNDWPGNNFEMWKYTGAPVEDNKYSDGRWRFLSYDDDSIYMLEDYGCDVNLATCRLASLAEGSGAAESTTFGKVMKSTYYYNKFVNIIKELLAGPFATENVLKIIDEEEEKIELQMRVHSKMEEYQDWKEAVEELRAGVVQRNTMLTRALKYMV